MRVVLTETAYSDLLEIGRAIAKDSPSRALSFVEELYDRCKGLSTIARAFPLTAGLGRSGRSPTFGDYLIFYRALARNVQVRVLHGARDYERLLFPDE